MRIDKYVWQVRLTKTRVLSSELISKGKIKLNNAAVKPSNAVKVGDVLSFLKHNSLFEYQVLEIPKSRLAAKQVVEFLKDFTSEEELEKYRLYQLQQSSYRKDGTGKPSKKDRRNFNQFWEEE